jgi:hypothetical protein
MLEIYIMNEAKQGVSGGNITKRFKAEFLQKQQRA